MKILIGRPNFYMEVVSKIWKMLDAYIPPVKAIIVSKLFSFALFCAVGILFFTTFLVNGFEAGLLISCSIWGGAMLLALVLINTRPSGS